MSHRRRSIALVLAVGLLASIVLGDTVGAAVTRTSGTAVGIDVSWIEYDPDDVLGLPGNVHVGYLYGENGPYGYYIFGSVTDFECDEGETPWGGHGVVVEVVDEGAEAVTAATEDAIAAVVESGASEIDAGAVVGNVKAELSDEIPDVIEDEFEEVPACDYLQDRYLDGQGTASISVNLRTKTARLTGSLTVTNGGHGEPGDVLATPPVDITITGGDWEKYEYSYKSRGANYRYSDWQKGTRYYGGAVTGGIGMMGFADDADDVAFGGFNRYKFETVQRIR